MNPVSCCFLSASCLFLFACVVCGVYVCVCVCLCCYYCYWRRLRRVIAAPLGRCKHCLQLGFLNMECMILVRTSAVPVAVDAGNDFSHAPVSSFSILVKCWLVLLVAVVFLFVWFCSSGGHQGPAKRTMASGAQKTPKPTFTQALLEVNLEWIWEPRCIIICIDISTLCWWCLQKTFKPSWVPNKSQKGAHGRDF